MEIDFDLRGKPGILTRVVALLTLLLHKQHDGKCGKTKMAMFSGVFDVSPGHHQR
jgi:hypothetical protein